MQCQCSGTSEWEGIICLLLLQFNTDEEMCIFRLPSGAVFGGQLLLQRGVHKMLPENNQCFGIIIAVNIGVLLGHSFGVLMFCGPSIHRHLLQFWGDHLENTLLRM